MLSFDKIFSCPDTYEKLSKESLVKKFHKKQLNRKVQDYEKLELKVKNLFVLDGISSNQFVTTFDLEDKIIFRGVGNDMMYVVWVSCLVTNMFYNEETTSNNKDIEVEKLGNTRHIRINKLWCCYHSDNSEVFKGKVAGIAASKDVLFVCKVVLFMYFTMRSYGYVTLVRRRERKKWDPGRHLAISTTVWSFKFKQWDPGKIYVASKFYNLEDKVDFDGVSNVMILEAEIMPSPKVKGSGDSSTF
ncbi:hypothetical protein TSUD_140480 [Trifolium subterraneum]|uniref:Uncharacterized protein n=1 Tax=Trifolium subterraneum TaxID=3900 RepID=A0A2Z6NER8_TRISU|nr:hypothetical protein TSUD_140480 [Trifolium subterraneum]